MLTSSSPDKVFGEVPDINTLADIQVQLGLKIEVGRYLYSLLLCINFLFCIFYVFPPPSPPKTFFVIFLEEMLFVIKIYNYKL